MAFPTHAFAQNHSFMLHLEEQRFSEPALGRPGPREAGLPTSVLSSTFQDLFFLISLAGVVTRTLPLGTWVSG